MDEMERRRGTPLAIFERWAAEKALGLGKSEYKEVER